MKSIPVLALVVLLLGTALLAVLPGYLTSPMNSQTQADMELGHTLLRFAAPVVWANFAVGLVLAVTLWRRPERRLPGRIALVLVLVVLAGGALFNRRYMGEHRFTPLPEVVRVGAGEVSFIQPDDLILGVRHDGESAAYPVPIIAYHHIANDRLAGEPFVVTY